MNYTNYIKINIDNLKNNISKIKNNYKYENYILNVSNNAFNHGIYLINYLKNDIDYLYTNNFQDIFLIRKFNKKFKIILNDFFTKDSILDIINNDIILIIKNIEELKLLNTLNLYSKINIILNIDISGLNGFKEKFNITDALDIIKDNSKINLLGIKSIIKENEYNDFLYIAKQLFDLNLELYILNNEDDKNKIKNSNSIKLDNSIYGINNNKNKLFKKEIKEYKLIFELHSKIIKVTKEIKGKKEKYLGVIPFGYSNGFSSNIKKILINNKLYNVLEIYEDYIVIEIDNTVSENDECLIISDKNWNENSKESLNYFNIFNSNLPIVYDDYILEKTYIY